MELFCAAEFHIFAASVKAGKRRSRRLLARDGALHFSVFVESALNRSLAARSEDYEFSTFHEAYAVGAGFRVCEPNWRVTSVMK